MAQDQERIDISKETGNRYKNVKTVTIVRPSNFSLRVSNSGLTGICDIQVQKDKKIDVDPMQGDLYVKLQGSDIGEDGTKVRLTVTIGEGVHLLSD